MNDSNPQSDVSRREFIKGGSLATLLSMLGGVELTARAQQAGTSISTAPTGPNIKCAVIGLGSWGRDSILSTLLQTPGVEVASICDTYPAYLRRGAKAAPQAKAVEDYRAILDDKDVKGVLVATPSHQHKDIVVQALQAGKHVYCEAPLAATIEEARQIAQAARSHPKQFFQAGLQNRADPQRHFLLPFVRAGAHGKNVQARAQWHRKETWRRTSPNADRERELNWRLNSETSPGLIGELGIHQLDGITWFYNRRPVSVTGFGSIIAYRDGRDVPDTVQAILEYPDGVRVSYDATLGSSFDGEYELLYGLNAAIMLRDGKAWMFKEADAPLLGWEVYARKDSFYEEVGIALAANASKISAQADNATTERPITETPLFHALQSFANNVREYSTGVEDFMATFGTADDDAIKEYLAGLALQPVAGFQEGYEATVVALKATEAVRKNGKVEIDPALFELG